MASGHRTRLRTGIAAFGERHSFRLSYAVLAAGIRLERTPNAGNSRVPYHWATPLYR
jgi:hypothetical protein